MEDMESGHPSVAETVPGSVPRKNRTVSKKLLVVAAAALLISASGFWVWHEYFRHWTIDDLEDAVVVVDEYMPIYQGFETDLAGRTVTVDVDVKSIRPYSTNLGQLNIITPEGGRFVTLVQWGEMDAGVGDRLRMDVAFEWSTVNGVELVYSPQVGTPGLNWLAGSQVIIQAVNFVRTECVIEVEDLGDDVVVEIVRIPEPVPLDMSRCHIRAGTETDTMDYIDLLGFYGSTPDLDTITDLTDPSGLNGTIEFSDRNEDGHLDDGDTFTLRDLARPQESSGAQTYLLMVERDLYPDERDTDLASMTCCAYLVMTHQGLMWASDPQGRPGTAFSTLSPDRVTVTADYISTPTRWDETELLLSCEDDYVTWYPDITDLSAGPGASYSCGEATIGDISVECVVTDVAGNGFLDEWDKFDLIARNGTTFLEGMSFVLRVFYSVADTTIFGESIEFFTEPTSDCLVLAEDDSITVTFAPIHNGTDVHYQLVDVIWDDIVVRITDGVSSVEWNSTYEALSGGDPVDWTSEALALGDLSLVCVIHDLQGNGLADAGDRVEVASEDGGAFDPGTTYAISVVYAITGFDIFSSTFTGVA
ncbi:MAG: hypothetical protein AB7S97_06355 [Thermoplasmata archaeon]